MKTFTGLAYEAAATAPFVANLGAYMWQPIDIYPCDGTKVLMTNGRLVWVGWSSPSHPYWSVETLEGEPTDTVEDPTHWMPLPDPPR